MGLRFRKSFNVSKGVKLNLNKKSVGMTFGGNGVHYTVNSSGKRTASAGIPGTGLYYTKTSSSSAKHNTGSTNSPMPNMNPQIPNHNIICPNCGFSNSNDFIYCASCNHKLPDHVIVHNAVPPKKKFKPATAVLIGVICLLGIFVLGSLGSNDDNNRFSSTNTESTELTASESQSETDATETTSETPTTEITAKENTETESETSTSEVLEDNNDSSAEITDDNSSDDSQAESDNITDNQSEENYADTDVSSDQSDEAYTSDSDSSSDSTTDYAESNDTDSAAVSDNSNQEQQNMVWVNGTGKKYHRRSDCSNMKNAYQVTEEEAENMGKEPCKKCY